MTEHLDINQVASAAFTNLVKAAFDSVCAKGTKAAKEAWGKIFEDFEPFMKDAYQKNAFVRLLSQKEKDAELYSVYVKSSFICGNDTLDDDELIFKITDGKNVVINGNGGAGKTFFMRHLWLTLFNNVTEFTPIFIELRKLNDITNIDIKSFIRRSISVKKELSDDLFAHFCNSGRFCFILDGFDEVILSQRNSVQAQILNLCSEFPNCRFVVSSRYERRFAGWQNFELYESKPFDLEKVRTLVERVPFDPAAKKLFLKQLDEEFYRENESFLSNPLLAIMMMMTFKENMDIPRRMNIFYDQAFTTLYQWHDATKAFSRAKTLEIDEFQRSFGMFCLLSYHQEKFEFTKSEVIELITKSSKVCGIKADPEEILKDYEETVNLLKQEGLSYVFIHRSFQEYFCAYALTRIINSKFPEIFQGIRRRYNDNVLLMCFEMNRGLVIEKYLHPLFNRINDSGFFKKNSSAKFNFISAIGLVYFLYFHSTNNVTTLSGIRFLMNEDIEEMLNNISKLMGFKPNTMQYSETVMFNHEVFRIANEAVKRIKVSGNVGCRMTFDSDAITINDVDCEVDSEKELFYKKISNSINKLSDQFLFLEKNVSNEIEKIRKWSISEIDGSEKRDKTLDDILGL
ncbi:NACHT domain-containing NTPase [Brucella intermedia]|uniref:NACHT domain-containing NTPase n=1 Tax=Brucella intermedia TaxID=94625 RepID=UPI0034CE33FE